jgi:hypothetical protein
LLSRLPTAAKFRSLSSANNGSVEALNWCFFLFSFLSEATGALGCAGDVPGANVFDGPGAGGGVSKETGNST